MHGAHIVWIRAAMLGGDASRDVSRCREYCENNVILVGRVLNLCDAVGCHKILYDSSEQVFGDSGDLQHQTAECEPTAGNFYGASKLIAEKLLRFWAHSGELDAARSVQIMRYSRVRDGATRDVVFHMVAAALAGNPIRLLGNGDKRVSFVHLDDVIEANLLALGLAPRFAIYHVSSDRPIRLFDLALRVREWVAAVTNKSVPLARVPVSSRPEWEPHVVGMEWESSMRTLGLKRPNSLDEMIAETISIQQTS
jgi:nucleoside-diphosphate-sugar epimerase